MISAQQSRSVLFLDDKEEILSTIHWMFDPGEGWDLRTFANADEAIAVVRGGGQFEAAVIDLHLSMSNRIDGVQVIKELAAIRPDLPIVALTGHPDYVAAAAECIQAGAVQFMRKPVHHPELQERVTHAVWI